MKLHKLISMRKRRGSPKPKVKPVESDPIITFSLVCELCGEDTGKTRDIRASTIDPGSFSQLGIDPKDPKLKDGMCKRCMEALGNGQTILVDAEQTRMLVLTKEGTNKLVPEARGRIIRINNDAFEQVWERRPR